MTDIACNQCGTKNRNGTQYCRKCGAPLPPATQETREQNSAHSTLTLQRLVDSGAKLLTPIMAAIENTLAPKSTAPKEPPNRQTAPVAPVAAPAPVHPRNRGDKISHFVVTQTITSPRSPYVVYYQAFMPYCKKCRKARMDDGSQVCTTCGTPYESVIIRHSTPSRLPGNDANRDHIRLLSQQNMPGILPMDNLFELDGEQVLVFTKKFKQWRPLDSIPLPQPPELVVAWCTQLGYALVSLHTRSMTLIAGEPVDIRSMIIISENQQALFTDLTTVARGQPDEQFRQARKADIRALGRLMYLLTTGKELRASSADAPASIRPIIEHARLGKYGNVDEMLYDLQSKPPVELNRSLRQTVGYATHLGLKRKNNEDFVGVYSLGMAQTPVMPQLGLYLVADGMGGYAVGEKASDLVVRTIVGKMQELQAAPALKGVTRPLSQAKTAGDILAVAVQQANKLLYETRKTATSGNQRGTTLTAALIQGEAATVLNAGDSRTYLLRNKKLQQITKDHSLVASLVSAGIITLEEARSHPQRNQIYRNLGEKPYVELDIFNQMLLPEDSLLLCSDGLWEMLRDEAMEHILNTSSSPQVACDELVQTANAAGGEDNISVIVIRME